MSTGDYDLTDQAGLAALIERQGWRQGSVFRPPETVVLPDYMAMAGNDWLVVSTQSCSVCAPDFTREPLVEVVAASPLRTYKSGHKDAKGGNNRVFHLPVKGLLNTEALVCHIARRAFLPRELLPSLHREAAWIDAEHVDAFKGWLANYYMRIALPNELVKRLREDGGICAIMKDVLANTFLAEELHDGEMHQRDVPLHERISSIHIKITSYEELPAEKAYGVSLVVVCDTDDASQAVERALSRSLGTTYQFNDVFLQQLVVAPPDNVTLADLQGHSRFNEWDDLSSLGTRLESMRQLDC